MCRPLELSVNDRTLVVNVEFQQSFFELSDFMLDCRFETGVLSVANFLLKVHVVAFHESEEAGDCRFAES